MYTSLRSTRLQHDGHDSPTVHLSGSIKFHRPVRQQTAHWWLSTTGWSIHPLLITAAVNVGRLLGGRRPLEGQSLLILTRSLQHYVDWKLHLQNYNICLIPAVKLCTLHQLLSSISTLRLHYVCGFIQWTPLIIWLK